MLKVHHNFDFKSVDQRLEKTVVDPYRVQIEDYENINDLVNRSIRTKTKLDLEKIPGAEYDDDKIIDMWLSEAGINNGQRTEVSEVKQSDDEETKVQSPDVLSATQGGSGESL